jgi:hypothetical protein
MRYVGHAGLILGITFFLAVIRLYWTGDIGLRLFWMGFGVYVASVFGSVALMKWQAHKACERDVRRGFEVLPNDQDD